MQLPPSGVPSTALVVLHPLMVCSVRSPPAPTMLLLRRLRSPPAPHTPILPLATTGIGASFPPSRIDKVRAKPKVVSRNDLLGSRAGAGKVLPRG